MSYVVDEFRRITKEFEKLRVDAQKMTENSAVQDILRGTLLDLNETIVKIEQAERGSF